MNSQLNRRIYLFVGAVRKPLLQAMHITLYQGADAWELLNLQTVLSSNIMVSVSQKWRWTLGAKFVDKEMMDRLDALYMTRPEFYFAQEPARYPDRIYRCILENPILRVPYTSQWKGNGYSIEMEVAEM